MATASRFRRPSSASTHFSPSKLPSSGLNLSGTLSLAATEDRGNLQRSIIVKLGCPVARFIFANRIRRPPPLSPVGEVKCFTSDSPQAAVRELCNAARQAAFYLGAFHDLYQAALIVVADTLPNHSFFEGMKLVKSDLGQRFGTEAEKNSPERNRVINRLRCSRAGIACSPLARYSHSP